MIVETSARVVEFSIKVPENELGLVRHPLE